MKLIPGHAPSRRQIVIASWDGQKFMCGQSECLQSRGNSVIGLLKLAFSQISANEKNALHPFIVNLWTGDYPTAIDEGYHAFCHNTYSSKLVPDFNFMGWPEVRIKDYEETCSEILKASKTPPQHNKLFWAGCAITNTARGKLIEITDGDNRMDINDIGFWLGEQPKSGLSTTSSGFFVSLPDHCKYKYLIDIQGWGYSGRVKHLLHTNRPLFYQERNCNEYWFFRMKPFIHYIPLKNDLSDFYERFEWAENNYKDCLRIAKNAQQFAITNLRRRNAINRYKDMILGLGKIDKKK